MKDETSFLTNTENSLALEVQDVNSELEEYVTPASVDAEEMADEDDKEDTNDSNCNEAPYDGTVVVRGYARLVDGNRKRFKWRRTQTSQE